MATGDGKRITLESFVFRSVERVFFCKMRYSNPQAGYSYCRQCILDWYIAHDRQNIALVSPVTNEPLADRLHQPNCPFAVQNHVLLTLPKKSQDAVAKPEFAECYPHDSFEFDASLERRRSMARNPW